MTSKYLQTFTDPYSHKSHMEYFAFIQVHSCGTAHCSFTTYIKLLKLTHHSTRNNSSLTSLLFSPIDTAYRSVSRDIAKNNQLILYFLGEDEDCSVR